MQRNIVAALGMMLVCAGSARAFSLGETAAAAGVQSTLASTASRGASSGLQSVDRALKTGNANQGEILAEAARKAFGEPKGFAGRAGTGSWVKGSANHGGPGQGSWKSGRGSDGWVQAGR